MYPHHKQVICVKNLPEYTDQIIHHLFGNFGRIISYRFVNTPDPYRKDAIVEFEHPQAPIDARNVHNGRIMGSNKLFIDILPIEQVNAPNNRCAEMNNPRVPFGNWNDSPMGGPDFRPVNQFRNNENNGHFHTQRNEDFHMQGPPNNNLNHFGLGGGDIHINHDIHHRPEINRGPEHVNNPHMFNTGPGINSPTYHQQNMNFRPLNQPMGYQVPNSPMHNEYRSQNPMPNMSPGRVMQHHPNNIMMSPQQQGFNPHNMYPPKPQHENNYVNRNQITIDESPRADDAAITAALAKYPELKAQIGNPELMKTIIDICRKEASALIENRIPNQDRAHIEPSYMNNNRLSPLGSSHHHKHHSHRENSSRSRSRSSSWSRSRSRHHNSPKQHQFTANSRPGYNNYPRSRSRSYSRSTSRSRSYSPVPDAYHNRQQHQPYQPRNRSPMRENHYHRSHDHKRRHHEHRKSPSRSPGRSHYRERNRSRSHDRQKERIAYKKYTPEKNQNTNTYKMEFSEGRKVLVIDEDGQKNLNQQFTQKTRENKETGDMLHPIACEDQDLSLSSTVDSNIDQLNLQELHKQPGVHQQQPLSQQKDRENKISKSASNEGIELKYPQFDRIISKMEAYRENEKNSASYKQKRMDCMAPLKPTTDKKFVYSSRMEINKESNYPFDPNYDWPLATVLGVYPDDLGSLDFMENLEGNIRNLLEIPQACPIDIGTFSKNLYDTLLGNENVVTNKTGGELLDEQGDANNEGPIKEIHGVVASYDEEGFQEDLYEIQVDERGKEKGVTPVKVNYPERNNFNRFRNRFFGNGQMNRFKGRNKPFDH